MDDWILNQWLKNDGVGFGKNKVSIEYPMINEWNGVCRPNDEITNQNKNQNHYWFWLDQREWKKHLWIKSNQACKQYSKLISIELSGMDDHTDYQVVWHFEDLEYLNNINIQYSEILSNVTERGSQKLLFSEFMDVRFGRSTFFHFGSFHYYFALSMNMNVKNQNKQFVFLQVQQNQV